MDQVQLQILPHLPLFLLEVTGLGSITVDCTLQVILFCSIKITTFIAACITIGTVVLLSPSLSDKVW